MQTLTKLHKLHSDDEFLPSETYKMVVKIAVYSFRPISIVTAFFYFFQRKLELKRFETKLIKNNLEFY